MLDSLLSMTWRDALFLYWPVDPAVVDRLPAGVDLGTRDGRARLGVVAFVMEDVRPREAPSGRSLSEVNLRTYARTNTPFATDGSADPADGPLVYYCPGLSVTAGTTRREAGGLAARCAG